MSHAPDPGTADPFSLRGVVPPTVTALDGDGDVDPEATAAHAEFVVDRPVYAYHVPGRTGNRLSASTVDAVANVLPELVVDCYEAYDGGEVERARDRQETVFEVRRALEREPHVAGVKTALSLRDLDLL